MTTDSDKRIERALEYAGYGWHVIPLHSRLSDGACSCPNGKKCGNSTGKHPRMGNWQNIITVTNCIFWGNSPDEIYNYSGTPNISYCDIAGGYSGTGNINTDPLFVDADGADNTPGTEDDNLDILPCSPCINAGDPNYVIDPN